MSHLRLRQKQSHPSRRLRLSLGQCGQSPEMGSGVADEEAGAGEAAEADHL